jgi:hypothetical protein
MLNAILRFSLRHRAFAGWGAQPGSSIAIDTSVRVSGKLVVDVGKDVTDGTEPNLGIESR